MFQCSRVMGSSPHSRGAHCGESLTLAYVGIIPAFAGSTTLWESSAFRGTDHPRIRGEHGPKSSLALADRGSSPHSRGAPLCGSQVHSEVRIIPAFAGSTASVRSRTTSTPDHPRIRGEHTKRYLTQHDLPGSSPHSRGAHSGSCSHGSVLRIIPAFAGSTIIDVPEGAWLSDHPRIRGEHGITLSGRVEGMGSSPHSRGALTLPRAQLPPARIIPAFAGSTSVRTGSSRTDRDHPRIRGEHRCPNLLNGSSGGSSPHSRGALCRVRRAQRRRGIIPAFAGSTRAHRPAHQPGQDHPRIRGEHSGAMVLSELRRGSSPHSRGAHVLPSLVQQRVRIIPAFAGSTRTAPPPDPPAPDHPRIRGEHAFVQVISLFVVGSSPHSRGARIRPSHLALRSGIISAFAGSTHSSKSSRSS